MTGCLGAPGPRSSDDPSEGSANKESFEYAVSEQLPIADSPVRGNSDANVTIVLFCSFSAHTCIETVDLVDEIQQQRPSQIRFVYKYIPYAPPRVDKPESGSTTSPSTDAGPTEAQTRAAMRQAMRREPNAKQGPSAEGVGRDLAHGIHSTARSITRRLARYRSAVATQRAAEAAIQTDQFWPILHHFETRELISPIYLHKRIEGRTPGEIDLEALRRAFNDTSFDSARTTLERNLALARDLHIRQRATLFINGKRIVSPEERKPLEDLVDQALKQARALIQQQGVAPEDLYRTAVADNLAADVRADQTTASPSAEAPPSSDPRAGSESRGEDPEDSKSDTSLANEEFIAVDAGYSHTCAIKQDHSMRCWGRGANPDENVVGHNQASPPPGKFRLVSSGYEHTCAIRTDGLVDCWSHLYSNDFGFKDKERTEGADPDLPPRSGSRSDLPDGKFEHVESAETRTCGVETDGTAVCWSDEPGSAFAASGPMALDGTYRQISPERAYYCTLDTDGAVECEGNDAYGRASPPDGSFVQLVTASAHACARRADGTVTCWGRDYDGQASPPDDQFTTIDADGDHSCGVTQSGDIKCWGLTSEPGADEHRHDYELYPPPDGTFTDVTVGLVHNCAIRKNDSIVCWGADHAGQVGIFGESYDNKRSEPPPEHDRSKMPQARAGSDEIAGTAHSTLTIGNQNVCAVRRQDGGLDCWGIGTDPSVDAEGGKYDYDRAYPSDGTYTDVVSGTYHACGLRKDGWVDCWGKGVNTVFNRMSEYNQAAPKAGEFTAIASGADHVCGLRPSGRIDCWGRGYTTEAGSKWGGRGEQETASPPDGQFVAIDASGTDNCALAADGSVTCWGLKTKYGGSSLSPPENVRFRTIELGWSGACGRTRQNDIRCWGDAPSPPDRSFTQIAVGAEHACGLLENGEIECWGSNDSGQTIVPRGSFTSIFAAGSSSCAIEASTHHIRCWGASSELLTPPGTGPVDRPLTPGRRVGLKGTPEQVTVGRRHSCARMADGDIRCWGGNGDGQLGTGDTDERPAPRNVRGLSGVMSVAAGDRHTCAATEDGNVYCWGDNGQNQLGLGATRIDRADSPRKLDVSIEWPDERTIRRGSTAPLDEFIRAGADHTCALDKDGDMRCWGTNTSGQLGTGRFDDPPGPQPVQTLNDIRATTLDKKVTCAMRRQGDLFCWGAVDSLAFNPSLRDDDASRLYLDETGPSSSKDNLAAVPLPKLVPRVSPASRVATGKGFICLQTGRSSVTCKGGPEGQFDFADRVGEAEWPSDGGITGSPLKDKYGTKSQIVDLDAGRSHVCAVLAVGRVYCWGDNRRGQLGTGDTQTSYRPERVDDIRLGHNIAAGPLHTCVLTHRNGVKCWGDNRFFQLGRGD